jgi:acyl carrier protein
MGMGKKEFIEKLKEVMQLGSRQLNEDTDLRRLKEYDSLSILGIIAMVDRQFGKKITAADFYKKVTTVKSLMKIIGERNFI